MKTLAKTVLILFVGLLLVQSTWAAVCPVTKRKAKDKYKMEYKGNTYYFSSRGAMKLFKMRPTRYVKAPKEQVKCPVMGGTINKKIFTEYKGKRIYFCCAGCIPTFKASPEKYLKKLASDCMSGDCASACSEGGKCSTDNHHKHVHKPAPQKKKPVIIEAPACATG